MDDAETETKVIAGGDMAREGVKGEISTSRKAMTKDTGGSDTQEEQWEVRGMTMETMETACGGW